MNKNGFAPIILVFIVVGILVAGTGAFLFLKNQAPEPVFCTQEAKQCPDGSYVGRTGPNCEFAKCPSAGSGQVPGEDDGLFKTTGTVMGRVSIGPLCPVEREGVPCGPEDIYSSRRIILNPNPPVGGGGRPVDLPFYIALNTDGTFSEEIPEGNYELTITDCAFLGCRYEFPKPIRVDANKTLTLSIDVDTGIR